MDGLASLRKGSAQRLCSRPCLPSRLSHHSRRPNQRPPSALEGYSSLESVRQAAGATDKQSAKTVVFKVDAPSLSTPLTEVLECGTLRHLLKPHPSPFNSPNNGGSGFVDDNDRVALRTVWYSSPKSSGAAAAGVAGAEELLSKPQAQVAFGNSERLVLPLPPYAVRAGTRETIFFDPAKVTAAVVTCGDLCPGMNAVVHGVARRLHAYGVPQDGVLGVRHGFRGFWDTKDKMVLLDNRRVESLHLRGGTVLGSSRSSEASNSQRLKEITRRIRLWDLNMLFVVGGEGAHVLAFQVSEWARTERVPCVVVAVPKSIDNELLLIDRCFGYDTAVAEAQRALLAAKVEASSARFGIGLVKLQGRYSGNLALRACLSGGVVDACLVPEVPFKLHGEGGLIKYVEEVLERKGHAVICLAEGAGQDLMCDAPPEIDSLGNPVLGDVGSFLKSELRGALPHTDIKYIDPTYMIRTIAPNAVDKIYCRILSNHAVDAAFAGYTGVTVGEINSHFALLPMPVLVASHRRVDPQGTEWNLLRSATGQPCFA